MLDVFKASMRKWHILDINLSVHYYFGQISDYQRFQRMLIERHLFLDIL